MANEGDKVEKSDAEWREQLGPEQYQVARQAGTEQAFTGKYWDCKDDGNYHCVCCDALLFRSDSKFDSGTGWPSFFEPTTSDAVVTRTDRSMGVERVAMLKYKITDIRLLFNNNVRFLRQFQQA